jgi:uncharacterized membrane protein YagU involved in acid resistance
MVARLLAIGVRPTRMAPAQVTLLVVLATWLVAAAAALEWQLLGYAGLLAVETGVLVALLPRREPARPYFRRPSPPLLILAALGVVPRLAHAEHMFRGNAGVVIGDVTMGVDHYAFQGAMALAMVAVLAVAAARLQPGQLGGEVVEPERAL